MLLSMDEVAALNERLYDLRKPFKLAFCALKEQKEAWEECMEKARPHLIAIVTLREIQVNCWTAKLAGSELLSKCPDIRVRVVRRVENELFQEKEKLESILKTLKKSQNLCTSACQQAVEIYDRLAQNRSIEDICFRSETCPSVADMLEWITCTEQHFSSHVHARELLLEEANFGDDFKAGTFVKEWKDDSALIESMNDVLATTKFVMDMV
ncbi:AFG2-interacting ribosome maturation factor-like isoform X2 [Dermacentor andersoni]|uniref:AFG2-interacting ribosome maturation factor-like isoform X2 n=1 Tax=Dermacentor andersoni TaxID=34620 RepID=UPI0021555259|nr:ribosome biogenesis protein C1orf109 homolog isoform X2 [Dermacentor andersoni]